MKLEQEKLAVTSLDEQKTDYGILPLSGSAPMWRYRG